MKQENNDSKICPICGRPTHKESKYCIFHASAEEKTEKDFKQALKEYVKKIKKEDSNYYFEKFIFIGDINFKEDLNITVFKKANFLNATFEAELRFSVVTFEGHADFSEATFKDDVDFSKATFEGFAAFELATFEGDADFSEVTFKRDADFLDAAFEGDANFSEVTFEGYVTFAFATFKGDVDFLNATFEAELRFSVVTFEGHADFRDAIFKDDVDFSKATIEGFAAFGDAVFKGDADFSKVTFKGDAEFMEAIFEGDADFSEATFEEKADFSDVTIELYADFSEAIFKGDADFSEAIFKGDADFSEAIFKGDADFKLKYLVKDLNLFGTKMFNGMKLLIKVKHGDWERKVMFERSYLENVYLDIELVESILIDFNDVFLRNTDMQRKQIENHILQEEKGEYLPAKKIFLRLKNNFHSIGQYKDESWAFKKEKDMERKSNCHFETLDKWLWSCFLNGIFGYGEQPSKIIVSAIVVILFFALSFSLIGLGNPEIIELKGTAIHLDSGNIVDLASKGLLKNNVIRNFPDSLYFSTITFTALFVYTFARKTGGR
jgi:uncharacterized protein YjbI with pentapeptide repeats